MPPDTFLTDMWNFVLSIVNAKDIIQNIDIKDKRKENKQNCFMSLLRASKGI